nr:carboxypeptidase-like regulatory domain-containing protein [Deltaproteobacteria bacterium]
DPGLGLLGLFENSNWLVTRLRWLEKKTWKNRPLRIATVITLVAVMTACVLPMANRPEFAVTGTVTDAETGQPIAGAEIYDDGYNDNKIKTVTDEQGRFTLKTANEEHNISAKADGYQPQKKGLYTFPFANNKNFNFDLEQLSSSQSKDIKAWVEDFFKHNYRDITARKTLEWGEPITSDNGNISIRYKYEATIWGKDKIIENKVWTFDKQGKFIHVRKVGAEDIYSLAGVQALVEDFFANNYQDITQRKTIEWGLPVKHENGNVSIRYKYEATIWDADKVINNEIYTFDKNGKFISVKIVGLKDLNTYKNIDPEDLGIAVYKVNKLVSSFPESIDFSLPENTYVMAQRIIAEGNTSAWPEISASGLATRMQKTQKQSRAVDPDRAKKELNVKILEVHQKGDYAAVIARNPGLLPSYDTRSFKLENGKWLNTGNSGSQTLATARAIVDQGIDYRNLKQMESTQNSDLSRVEPRELKPAPSETEGTENFPFTATLDNGVTVELVGLCEHPSEGKQWWKPGGDLLDTSPYEKIETSHISPRHGRKALEAAVKIDGFEDGIGFRSGIVGTQSSGSCGTGDQKVYAVSFDQAKGSSQTDINIGIAAGQWQTVATQKPNFSGVYSSGSVIWHGPIEKDGGTVLHIGHSLLDNNIRVVAVGPDDKEHQGGSTSAQKEGLESVQINFDLPLSKIKEFRFQVRPYEWVTFKNVSLRPSEKMEVEVSIDKQSN